MKPIKHYILKGVRNPEKVFRKIDKVMFGGYFRKMFDALEEKNQRKLEQFIAAHPEEYYDKHVHHPNRDWHSRYIDKYINDYDESLVERAYGQNPDFLQKIKEIFTKATTKK